MTLVCIICASLVSFIFSGLIIMYFNEKKAFFIEQIIFGLLFTSLFFLTPSMMEENEYARLAYFVILMIQQMIMCIQFPQLTMFCAIYTSGPWRIVNHSLGNAVAICLIKLVPEMTYKFETEYNTSFAAIYGPMALALCALNYIFMRNNANDLEDVRRSTVMRISE